MNSQLAWMDIIDAQREYAVAWSLSAMSFYVYNGGWRSESQQIYHMRVVCHTDNSAGCSRIPVECDIRSYRNRHSPHPGLTAICPRPAAVGGMSR